MRANPDGTYSVNRPVPTPLIGWKRREWLTYGALLFGAFGYTKAREAVMYNGFPDFFIDQKTGELFVRTPNGNRLRVEVNQQGDVEMWDDAGNFYYIDNKLGKGYGVDVMSPDGTVTNYKIPNSPTDRVDKDGIGKDVGMQSQRLGNVRHLVSVQTIPGDGGRDLGRVTAFVADEKGMPYALDARKDPKLAAAIKARKVRTAEDAWKGLFE